MRGEQLDGAHFEFIEWSLRTIAELRARAEAVETVLDTLITGVFTFAPEGRILHANRKGEQILTARDGLRKWHDRLRCANLCDTKRLDAAVGRASDASQEGSGRGSILAIRRPSMRRPFGVTWQTAFHLCYLFGG